MAKPSALADLPVLPKPPFRSVLRVVQKTQIRAALQESLESLPDRMWRDLIKKRYFKKERKMLN